MHMPDILKSKKRGRLKMQDVKMQDLIMQDFKMVVTKI